MTAQTKTVIKSYFQTGDYPTQAQFEDLIDSYQDYGSIGNNYYVDSGSANTYVITTSPVTTSYTAGQNVAVKIGNSNNGASTLDAGGGALPIVYIDGTSLNPGALPAGGIALLYTDTISWYLVNLIPAASGGGITALTGDVTASGSGSVTATIPALTVTNAMLAGSIDLTTKVTGDLPFANVAQLGANTVACNPTTGTADISTVALSASQLLGRGSTGNVAAITLDSSLTMSGTTLSVTSGSVSAATQAEQETGSSTSVYVSPGRQQYHPSACKFWADINQSTTTPSIATSYNVTSITDEGTGQLTITIANDFSSANWCCIASIESTLPPSATEPGMSIISGAGGGKTAGSVFIAFYDLTPDLADPNNGWQVCGFGDI